ncbi:glycosyltransferase [Phocaeicola sp.]
MNSKKKRKLYQINVVANSGSTGRIAEGIAHLALSDGFECYTAYGRWANRSDTHLYKIGNKIDIYFHVIQTRLFDRHGLASKRTTRKLIEDIGRVQPDIIHLHNIHGYYLNYPILFNYLSQLDIPIVWTLHDCWSYTGHCVHYTAVGCEKWRHGCFACPNLADYPQSLLWDSSGSNYKLKKDCFTSVKNMTIVTVSNWLASEVRESFLGKYPIKTIYNGLDIRKYHPIPVEKSKYGWKDKFVILGVATFWNQRKGLDDFIRLVEMLADDELIVLVGLSKEQIRKLPNKIIGLERTENVQQLVELYSLADVFMNFSVEETFGLTSIESMACGTPALVFDSTACPEVVNKDVGFVVSPHDMTAVQDVIKQIRRLGKNAYSQKCRSYVLRKFNDRDRYEEYVSLYHKLLDD